MTLKSDGSTKKRVGFSLLGVHVIWCSFAFSLVPGYEYLLIVPIVICILLIYLLENRAAIKNLLISAGFALALGFFIREVAYARNGVTPLVLIATAIIFFVSLACGKGIYGRENQQFENE